MKDLNKHSFEEQFKRKFDGAELAPPKHIWANIQQTLPKPVIVPFYSQNWFRIAATIVLILGISTWFVYPEFSNKTQNISQQEKQIKNSENQQNNLTNKTFKADNNTSTKEKFNIKDLTNLTTKKENTEIADNQGLTNKNTNKKKDFVNAEKSENFSTTNQKTNQLTTIPLIQDNKGLIAQSEIAKIDVEKIKLLDAVTLAVIKAQLENDLPLKALVLQDFSGFPIVKKEIQKQEQRFIIGMKVSAGNLNLNYSGDNSQNAIGLAKTLNDYDTTTVAIETNVFDNLRQAKGSQFSVGMDLAYFLSPKWSINSGFAFVNQKYSVSSHVLHTRIIPSTIQGTKEVTENISNDLETKWQSINVPLSLSYYIGSKKLTGSISFGIAANRLLTQHYKTERSAYAYKLGNQKKTYFNSVIGFKLNYKLAPRWFWSVGVDYKNALGSILDEERVSLRPETYQTNTGLYFSF